jgi:HEAT repeat protein
MDVVRGKDREMKRYAIVSLGLLGDQRVVPLFLEIFERRDPFNRMVEGKMEVLRALGQMKAIGAVPQLARVLRGRDWIPSRKRKELKLLIAQTLKEIGSGEAISALEWVYENRRGKVGKRCGELLGKEQG